MNPHPPASVLALRRALATGEVRAVDVVTDQLDRLRPVAAATNCVAAWNDEAAIAAARALDRQRTATGSVGALHGIPITVKDWIDVAGLPCTGGLVECRDRIPERDASVVARLRAEGATVIAKTTVQVDEPPFGRVSHPLDRSRSPGGSSSGEAAAVGGGGSILGIASDSGGSIRVPAAWCGVAALKPSAGLVPTTGHFPRVGERADGRTQIGPMAASVETLAMVLPVIAGPDGLDAGTAPVPVGDPGAVPIAGLRVGWCTTDAGWTADPAITRAIARAVAVLSEAGADTAGEIPHHLDESLDVTRRYWRRSAGMLPGADAEGHLVAWDRYRTRMLRETAAVDLVVMPVAPSVAPLHRPMDATDYVFSLPASLTGAPAVVVPTGFDEAGLPIAIQVVAHRWRDDIALAAALTIERAGPTLSSDARGDADS